MLPHLLGGRHSGDLVCFRITFHIFLRNPSGFADANSTDTKCLETLPVIESEIEMEYVWLIPVNAASIKCIELQWFQIEMSFPGWFEMLDSLVRELSNFEVQLVLLGAFTGHPR